MKKLKMIDLFSGGGGFSYAAEKLVGGYETIQFVEIDPYCQKVLKKHWPTVPIHDDIKTYKPKPHSASVVVGGFPCVDISNAGRKQGITKETRSGLFFELMRVVSLVRPKYIILENVAAITYNGLGIVLGELSQRGFNVEWGTFRASDYVNACHHRDRWFAIGINREFTDSNYNGSSSTKKSEGIKKTNGGIKERQNSTWNLERSGQSKKSGNVQKDASDSYIKRLQREAERGVQRQGLWPEPTRRLDPHWRQWGVEPQICRNDDGVPSGLFTNRASRLKLLGNAVIPACAAIPLQRVLDLENDSRQT